MPSSEAIWWRSASGLSASSFLFSTDIAAPNPSGRLRRLPLPLSRGALLHEAAQPLAELRPALPVIGEARDARLGERVREHGLQDLRWDRRDLAAELRSDHHVHRVPHRRGEHLRVAVRPERLDDLA